MAANPTPPDLTDPARGGYIVGFTPVSYWVPDGTVDPAAFIAALKQQPGLADFPDTDGNLQSAVRLDADADPANAGYWVSVPEGTSEATVTAALDVVDPPVPPPPPDPFVPASVAVETAVAAAMATVAITSPNLTAAQKQAIQTQVQQQVQAVVDAHLSG